MILSGLAAFQSRYGTSIRILGTFTGGLNNAGDDLTLLVLFGETILDFSYSDDWQPATDGAGFSLVVVNENAAVTAWNSATQWRASAVGSGSPGQTDPAAPSRPGILINEILANGDAAPTDAIELLNPTANDVDVGGWFLTDNHLGVPGKFAIPAGTIVPANGYRVFYESNSFRVRPNLFSLDANGDEV